MEKNFSNILTISSYNKGINRIFEDYCNGIKANCENYYYIDYIELYLSKGKRAFEAYIENIVTEKKIDAVFFIWWSCDLTFDIRFLEKMSQKTALVMNFFDTEYYFEGVDRYYAQLADLVILPDSLARYRYEHLNINAHTSFSLFDSSYYKKQSETVKDIDVSFVGNIKNADRAECIKYLKDNGINVQTYGSGSDNGFASFEQMVSIFNRSKINLNFTTLATSENYILPLPKINQRIRQSKGRCIEASLCGGFALSQHAAGIEEMFDVGKEFDVFYSKEQMLEKIKYYLTNEEKREEMAEKAYKKSLMRYDNKNGFAIIFDKLKKVPPRHQFPIYTDPVFDYGYNSSRFYYATRFVINNKFGLALEEIITFIKNRKYSLRMCYYFALKGVVFELLEKPKLYEHIKTFKNKLKISVKY